MPVLVVMAPAESEAAAAIATFRGPGKGFVFRRPRRQLARHDRDDSLLVPGKSDIEIPFVLHHIAGATARYGMVILNRRDFHRVDGIL